MAAVAVVLVLALNIAASRMARRSSFCDSCHYMAPYVEQWKTSRHAGVECVQCHPYDTKAVALSTVRYLSGAYNPRPRAEVNDQSCLASGCHDQRMLKSQEDFRGNIRFDHQAHLKGAVRGIHLRCTSCHNQIVQRGHIAVSDQVCYILRSNLGDVVLTPFMGVGSEVYMATRMGRKAIGIELKPSYFKQARLTSSAALNNWKPNSRRCSRRLPCRMVTIWKP